MKVRKIKAGEDTVDLRLTASKLAEYAAEIGSVGNTLFAVMDALDDMSKQGKLLTAALTYKGNGNSVKDGFELIDLLADEGYSAVQTKELIVDLAVDGGIVGRDDAAKLNAAIKAGAQKLYSVAAAVLSGDVSDIPNAGEKAQETEGNPT